MTPSTTQVHLGLSDTDDYEKVIQSSHEHIKTSENVAYGRVVT